MPCQSYDTSYQDSTSKLKKECDKLARIACKALTALEAEGKADFLLLEDDELREWWTKHQEADRKEKARVAEKERRARIKEEALARLSDEEREVLGLSKPKKSSPAPGKVLPSDIDWDSREDDEEYLEWDKEVDAEEFLDQLESEYHKLSDGTVIKTFKIR